MILKSVRIINYKSIIDSQEVHLSKDITIFIGKNESGKTNVLKAIRDINNLENVKSLFPNHYDDLKTQIKLKLLLNTVELNQLNEMLGDSFLTNNEFEILIDVGDKKSLVQTENLNTMINNHLHSEFKKLSGFDFLLNYEEFDESLIVGIDESNKNAIIEIYKELILKKKKYLSTIATYVSSNIPRMVYLSQIENNLPKTITADNLSTDAVKNFITFIAKQTNNEITKEDFKLLTVTSTSSQDKKRLCDDISGVLTKFFAENYKQYKIKFALNPNGSSVDIYVRDYFVNNETEDKEGACLYLEERSKGFNWFVSFVITCNSFLSNEIFILDEPGMDLHLEGQEDMLNVLKEISKEHQIMFCTHSPYLIDTTALPIVRLVEKRQTTLKRYAFDETIVCQNLHSYNDKDTISTLLDAIGYNITKGLTYHNDKAIIVEGISDLLLIKAFYKSMGKVIDFDIYFAKTTSKMEVMYSLLSGLGIKKILMLYDADKAGVSTYKEINYMQTYSLFTHLISEEYLTTSKRLTKEQSIEDIFSQNDFKKYYLLDNEEYFDSLKTNSEMAKMKNSKYLDSKILLDNIEDYEFDEYTIANINSLVTRIEEKFALYNNN